MANAQRFAANFIDGFILFDICIEGDTVKALLDTGAPGLVLNQKYHTSDREGSKGCEGISGTFACETKWLREVRILDKTKTEVEALVANLSFLENGLHRRIDALVGLDIFRGSAIQLDPEAKEIRVVSSKNKDVNGYSVRYYQEDHVPVVTCTIAGQKMKLGIDTGAETSLLFNPSLDEFVNVETEKITIIGTDNLVNEAMVGNMDITLSESQLPVMSDFIFFSSPINVNVTNQMDGLLGQTFLSQYIITIYPDKQRIHFQPRLIVDNSAVVELE